MNDSFNLRRCALLPAQTDLKLQKDRDSRVPLPIGLDSVYHGVLSPCGFPWAECLFQWFAVEIWENSHCLEIMSRSRLAEALKLVGTSPQESPSTSGATHLNQGRIEPAVRDDHGQDTYPYCGPARPSILLPYEMMWGNRRDRFPVMLLACRFIGLRLRPRATLA
jgi:hypothetical protein